MNHSKEVRNVWGNLIRIVARILKLLTWPLTAMGVALILKGAVIQLIKANFDHEIILEYLAILRWPAVALVVLFVARPYLPDLIKRMKKAGVGGASVEFEVKQSLSSLDTEELRRNEGATEQIGEDQTSPSVEELLTSTEAKLAYEQIYNYIFGTQIKLLLRLRDYPDGLKEAHLSEFYEQYKALAGENVVMKTFMAYMDYLKHNSLVTFNPETGVFGLTYAGEYFLRYLSETNKFNDYKPC